VARSRRETDAERLDREALEWFADNPRGRRLLMKLVGLGGLLESGPTTSEQALVAAGRRAVVAEFLAGLVNVRTRCLSSALEEEASEVERGRADRDRRERDDPDAQPGETRAE
jgi:hypothetical protein